MGNEIEVHEMDGYRQGMTTIWNCPVCGRKIACVSGLAPVVLEEGSAPLVEHRGSMALTVGVVLMSPPAPNPFMQWAEGADFSALD